jgi:RNA polymerase sigma-70 factor, ECF subfamily
VKRFGLFAKSMDRPHLVTRLIPRLRRYARALVADRQVADDLVQEALASAARLAQAPADEAGLRTWVFSLMHHAYVSKLRAQRAADVDAEPPPVPPQKDFEQAIAALSPEQREVFLLVSLEDFSYEQVASTLGIPTGTVMSRLSRARERLRSLLMGEARLKRVK